jgi:hypothetical protein
MDTPDALSIAYAIADESPEVVKLLVIGYRANGSTFSFDTGLTVDEAKEMTKQFLGQLEITMEMMHRLS